jgi:hypothetical protein
MANIFQTLFSVSLMDDQNSLWHLHQRSLSPLEAFVADNRKLNFAFHQLRLLCRPGGTRRAQSFGG